MEYTTGNNAPHKGHHAANSTAELLMHDAYETIIQIDTSPFLPVEKFSEQYKQATRLG